MGSLESLYTEEIKRLREVEKFLRRELQATRSNHQHFMECCVNCAHCSQARVEALQIISSETAPEPERETLSYFGVAEYLGRSVTFVRELVERGELLVTGRGLQAEFDRDSVVAWKRAADTTLRRIDES